LRDDPKAFQILRRKKGESWQDHYWRQRIHLESIWLVHYLAATLVSVFYKEYCLNKFKGNKNFFTFDLVYFFYKINFMSFIRRTQTVGKICVWRENSFFATASLFDSKGYNRLIHIRLWLKQCFDSQYYYFFLYYGRNWITPLQNSEYTTFRTAFSFSVIVSGTQLNYLPLIVCRGRNSSSGRGWSCSWTFGSSHSAHVQFGARTRWNQILVQSGSARYRAGKGGFYKKKKKKKWLELSMWSISCTFISRTSWDLFWSIQNGGFTTSELKSNFQQVCTKFVSNGGAMSRLSY